jgi:membrane protease YdiL (CAAX protease family)
MFPAAVAAALLLPRPRGIPRFQGIGVALTREGCSSGLFGLALGAVLAAAAIVGPWLAGSFRFEWGEPTAGVFAIKGLPTLPSAVFIAALLSFGEEFVLRGYFLQQLARALTRLGAVLAVALLFAADHAGHPLASWLALTNIFLIGILVGGAVVRYRSLWPAAGFHIGWNFSLIFLGAIVSGQSLRFAALTAVPVHNTLWNGGEYGPEASLAATFVILAGIFIVWKAPIPRDPSPLIWDE